MLAELLVVALRVKVATCPGVDGARLVQPAAWVQAHVDAANALLEPHRIRVTVTSEPFTPPRCELLDRADRNTLAGAVTMDGKVTVLVMARVRDLDVPSYDLKGVHWRARGRRWIFLTASARPPVLAHELAHYFGLPHDPAGGNLMTPGPSSPAWRSARPPAPYEPRLTPAQVKRLRAGVLKFLVKSGTVQPRGFSSGQLQRTRTSNIQGLRHRRGRGRIALGRRHQRGPRGHAG